MIVYITSNLINGKQYIGRDSKNDPNYLGSGKLLKKAIDKYGRHNFRKDVLQECISLDELKVAEEYWIKHFDAANNKNFYNILDGSTGGDTLTNHPDLEEIKDKIRNARSKQVINHSTETRKKISEAQKGERGFWYGKAPAIETRNKISNALKGTPKKLLRCPHCDKTGGQPQMKRWHFDNCTKITGKKHAPTNKQPWNKGLKNPYSDETLKKMSDSHKGHVPWNKGKKLL